jgi:hypothetical protein
MKIQRELTPASALVLLATCALLIGGYTWTAEAPISAPPRVAPRVAPPSADEARPAPMPLFPTLPPP